MVCSVEDKNAAALRLYDRLGYVREPERDWTPEPGVSLLVLGRELRSPDRSASRPAAPAGRRLDAQTAYRRADERRRRDADGPTGRRRWSCSRRRSLRRPGRRLEPGVERPVRLLRRSPRQPVGARRLGAAHRGIMTGRSSCWAWRISVPRCCLRVAARPGRLLHALGRSGDDRRRPAAAVQRERRRRARRRGATVAFVALALWPAFAARATDRRCCVPARCGPRRSSCGCWSSGSRVALAVGNLVGLAERVAAVAEAIWPLVVAWMVREWGGGGTPPPTRRRVAGAGRRRPSTAVVRSCRRRAVGGPTSSCRRRVRRSRSGTVSGRRGLRHATTARVVLELVRGRRCRGDSRRACWADGARQRS